MYQNISAKLKSNQLNVVITLFGIYVATLFYFVVPFYAETILKTRPDMFTFSAIIFLQINSFLHSTTGILTAIGLLIGCYFIFNFSPISRVLNRERELDFVALVFVGLIVALTIMLYSAIQLSQV